MAQNAQNLVTDWVVGMEDADFSPNICHLLSEFQWNLKQSDANWKWSFGFFKGVGFGNS